MKANTSPHLAERRRESEAFVTGTLPTSMIDDDPGIVAVRSFFFPVSAMGILAWRVGKAGVRTGGSPAAGALRAGPTSLRGFVR